MLKCPSSLLLTKRMNELEQLLKLPKNNKTNLYMNEYTELLECSTTSVKKTPNQEHFIKLRILFNQWEQSDHSLEIASKFLLELEEFRNIYETLEVSILVDLIKKKNYEYTDMIYDYCEKIRNLD